MQNYFKYKAGEIIFIGFPFTNLTDKKIRPALIVHDQEDMDVLVVPISTSVDKHKEDYLIKDIDYDGPPLNVESIIRYKKLVTLDSKLIIRSFSSLKKDVLENIQKKIVNFIDS